MLNRLAAPLVWIDMEMTGLDPRECTVLEIATVVTDAELEVLAVHYRGVELERAGGGQTRTVAGVEERIVLERDAGGEGRLDRSRAPFEQGTADLGGPRAARGVEGAARRIDGPGAAVDEDERDGHRGRFLARPRAN